jgi:hypothetical protein
MYNQATQSQLKEKLDYELWLLDFLSKTQETFEGGSNISTIILTNRQPSTHATIFPNEVMGLGTAIKVMDAMAPLTFCASFKILDMVFEWILNENEKAGNIQKTPWEFKKKIKIISSVTLNYPSLLQSEPYIRDYLFALYSKLLKFRNEIVHNNNFSVDGKLKVETIKNSKSYSIELDRGELGALVRTVVAAANLLTGVLSFGNQENCLFKYHLDRISKLHGLIEFKQTKPILVNVILNVPEEKNIFPVDVKFVREKINRIYPNGNVLFNLKIIGLVNDRPSSCWFFPIDSLPKEELFELQSGKYEEYLISCL